MLCSFPSLNISVKNSRTSVRVVETGLTFLDTHQLDHFFQADSYALVVLPLHDEQMRFEDCSETPFSERDFLKLAMQLDEGDSVELVDD